MEKNIEYKQAIAELLLKDSTKLGQMAIVFDYVKNKITWDQIYSKYSIDGVKNTWQKKRGNSGDINLLLLNILKDLGYDAAPLLVSERDHGKVDTTYPFADQFNKVVAYVKVDGNAYILDATDIQTPYDMISYDLLNTKAFLLDRKKPQFITVTDNEKLFRTVTSIQAEINRNGIFGNLGKSNFDYGYTAAKNKFKQGQKSYFEEYTGNPNLLLDSVKIEDADSSFTFTHEFKFQLKPERSGEYMVVPVNLFNNIKNPFTADIRFSDIDFGYRYLQMTRTELKIAPNLEIEALPKPVRMSLPDKWMTFSRNIQKTSDGIIVIELNTAVNESRIDSYYYSDLKEFYKKMQELLEEPILLKEKH